MLTHETIARLTCDGEVLEVRCPEMKTRVSVAPSTLNLLRARKFLFLVECGAIQGTLADLMELCPEDEADDQYWSK